MNQLEDRIRTSLHATAERIPETTTQLTRPVERPSRSRLRGPMAAVAAMMAVLVGFGISMWLLSPSGETSADGVPTVDRFPIPGHIPEGVELVYGSFAVPDPTNPPQSAAVVARATADGFEGAVLVRVSDWPDAVPYPSGESIVVNGYEAHLIGSDGEGATVWWEQGDVVVWVHATSADSAVARAVATSVRVAAPDMGDFADTVLSFSGLPAGYSVVASPAILPTQPRPVVGMERPRGPEDPELQRLHIEVFPTLPEHAIAGVASATRTEIRGRTAYRFGDGEAIGLAWEEGPGVTVVISGNYPESEILATAGGLKFVAEAEWRQKYDLFGFGVELPTTTMPTDDAPTTEPLIGSR